jgi:hypothetical protein
MPQAQIDVGGDVSKVMVGSVAFYVAPTGTTLPNLDGSYPIVWPAGWVKNGYTDAGVDVSYSPSVKEIKVDEETAPVMYVLDGEKCEVSMTVAEATLAHLHQAISASSISSPASPADATHGKFTTLKFGSGVLSEVMIGFEGYAPADTAGGTLLPAVGIGFRAMAQGNVKLTYKRADKQMFQVTFGLLADSTKSIGERLMKIIHITDPHT